MALLVKRSDRTGKVMCTGNNNIKGRRVLSFSTERKNGLEIVMDIFETLKHYGPRNSEIRT